jgi:hypothetical protein
VGDSGRFFGCIALIALFAMKVHNTTRITPHSIAEGIGNGARPTQNCKVAERESAAVLSAVGPPTGSALSQSCTELNSFQKQLLNVLREVAHPDIGVIARTKSANDSLLRIMATRAEQMEAFIVRLEKQIWATWLPVVASAALGLGFVLGSWFANARQAPCETTNAGPRRRRR